MWTMTYSLIAVVLATTTMAAEQPSTDEDPWSTNLRRPRPASRVLTEEEWVARTWHPKTNPLKTTTRQHWSTNEGRDNAWGSKEDGAFQFDPRENLDGELTDSEEAMVELVRQPPRSLGFLVDLYRDMFRGLSPFVSDHGNQMMSAKPERRSEPTSDDDQENQVLAVKPERRSGRRPDACRFGTFGFVCWNAARKGAVMRQRSAQYSQ